MKGNQISISEQRTKYIIGDWLASCVAIFLFNVFRFVFHEYFFNIFSISLASYLCQGKIIFETFLIPTALLGVYWLSGYYNQPFERSRVNEFFITVSCALFNTGIIFLALLTNDQTITRKYNYIIIIVLFLLLFVCTYTVRLSITKRGIRRLKAHKWAFNTLIIGNSAEAHKRAEELAKSTSRLGYNITGFVSIPGETDSKRFSNIFSLHQHKPYQLKDVPEICKRYDIDQIVLSPQVYDDKVILALLDQLFPVNLPIKIAPDTVSFLTQSIRIQDILAEPLLDLTTHSCSYFTKNLKRVIDVMFSTFALIILSPVFLVLAILIKRDSPGKVFYTQERIGYKQRPFRIIKFRSMIEDAEKDGPRLSSENDDRTTRIGKIMRKYRLDELPQFWNVLKGEMSLVGPRPERAHFIEQITKIAPYYTLLHQVKPGITSWGMVKYGYASSVKQMVARSKFDLLYLSNMSIAVDAKIIIYTFKTVISGRGM